MAPPALPFTRDVPPRARTRPVDPPRRPGHRRGVSHETPGDASRHRGATRGRPRDVEPRDPRAKHALVGHELRVQRERWREIRAVVGRVRADVRGVLERSFTDGENDDGAGRRTRWGCGGSERWGSGRSRGTCAWGWAPRSWPRRARWRGRGTRRRGERRKEVHGFERQWGYDPRIDSADARWFRE